jgi:uncharacterized protein YceK
VYSTRAIRVILLATLISGCSTLATLEPPRKTPSIDHPTFMFSIRESPEQLDDDDVNGTATWMYIDGVRYCIVNLRKYPEYLAHEMRHCIEGHWHPPDVPNSDYK